MPNLKFHGDRKLLNKPGFHSTGAIVAEIEDTGSWKPGCNRDGRPITEYSITPYSTLQFSDCTRAITFDLDLHTGAITDGGFENNLYKLDCMIDTLVAFRKGLAIEQRRLKARNAKLPKDQ